MLHASELTLSETDARNLIRAQFPELAGAVVEAVADSGTVNYLFRVGETHCARFPRTPDYETSLLTEIRWLKAIVNRLSISTPTVAANGVPGESYPLQWALYHWISGNNFDPETDGCDPANALTLAEVLNELHAIPTTGELQSGRCARPHPRDYTIEPAIRFVSQTYDAAHLRSLWQDFLALPAFTENPVWTHGDLIPPNLLCRNGHLAAVIDWGSLGEGDPAIDYIVAFTLFRGEARDVFRRSLGIDEASWQRARAYAFRQALRIIPYYHQSHAAFTRMAYHTLDEILST
ncbi:MAG: aminoglycoside phosphotransferase family protein [Pseudomonadales bacterium]|nr:aminoglycoside phosphotransferase family protein [Pseudomonadales bacterium]